MKSQEIADRYANALFHLGKTDGQLSEWLASLRQIVEILNANDKITKFFSSPIISSEEKKQILHPLLEGKIDAKLLKFISLLLKRNRIELLPKILRSFAQQVAQKLDILKVQLITAQAMDLATKERLKEKIERFYHKKIEWEEKLSPEVIGGFILKIGNQMLDMSIKGRLQRLKESLLAV